VCGRVEQATEGSTREEIGRNNMGWDRENKKLAMLQLMLPMSFEVVGEGVP
jgi:hypothetical protein